MRIDDAKLAEPTGTSECPICGVDIPHGHLNEDIAAWRQGWSVACLKKPSKSGWYLCCGHALTGIGPLDQAVRRLKRPPYDNAPAEVLYFDLPSGWFYPFWFERSGEVGDGRVYATPSHWRELPEFSFAQVIRP